MYICDLHFQDHEIGSLFVISVLLCYSCDCDFTVVQNRCVGVVPRILSDIGCLIVTLVKLQVFRVSSG